MDRITAEGLKEFEVHLFDMFQVYGRLKSIHEQMALLSKNPEEYWGRRQAEPSANVINVGDEEEFDNLYTAEKEAFRILLENCRDLPEILTQTSALDKQPDIDIIYSHKTKLELLNVARQFMQSAVKM